MANYNLTQTGAEVQELLNKVSLFGKFMCNSAADSQEKNIHIDDFTLIDGMAIAVTFVNGNSVESIRLNVNYTGNIPVYYRDSPLGAGLVTANATAILMYNATGSRWDVLNELCGIIGEAASRDVATEITDESSDEDIPTVGAVKGIMKGLPEQDCSFVFRKTAGGELTVPSGLAQLTAMRGKSLVWNQLINSSMRNGSVSKGITPSFNKDTLKILLSGTSTGVFDAILIEAINILTVSHKYAVLLSMPSNDFAFADYYNGISDQTKSYIFSAISVFFNIRAAGNKGVTLSYSSNIALYDLTEMFGAGNEPSTVEEFEAMFPNNYYPYNTGSLLNFNAKSLKTVGFNQWDEEWEVGSYSTVDGSKSGTSGIRSKNKIPVLAGGTYYRKFIRANYAANAEMCILKYRADGSFSHYNFYASSNQFTLEDDIAYITFFMNKGTTYNHDICINISDPAKNGTYEPYWESNLPLNINTQTGKLNGSGESIVVFPNGMAGMNDVQDTIIGNVATKKFNQVNDLTTLPIDLNYEGYYPEEGEEGDTVYSFILELPKNAKAFTASAMNGLFNKKYSAASEIRAASSNNFYIYTIQGKSYVEIMDDDFSTDARFADEEQWDALIADIRASLADKALMYELLSYESYTLDDMAMPLSYKIDKNGTEQIIPSSIDPDNTVPSTVPCDMTAKYKLSHIEEIWALFDMCHNG